MQFEKEFQMAKNDSILTPDRPMISSIIGLRCPVCREGKVFSNIFLKMHSNCPVCGLKFEREPGYFLGAMYFSYGMAIPILVATLIFLPMVVPIVRYSRVMWLHLDRFFDPQEPS
jgi:uncharacterized protein (DUF983 family)